MSGDEEKPLIVTGQTWSDLRPRLRIRQLDRATTELVPTVGFRLAYRARPDIGRWCTGRPPSTDPATAGAPTDCLRRAESTEHHPSSRYCVPCAVNEARVAASLHHAHIRPRADLDPMIRDQLARPNVLYLAGFRDGSIKVGTSTAHRTAVRLAEQGAWAARLVGGANNGFIVRRLEDAVTGALRLPQSVAVGRKIAGLARPITDRRLSEFLDAALVSVRKLEAVNQAMAGHEFHTEIHSEHGPLETIWLNPGFDDPLWRQQPLYPYPARLDEGAHDITLVAACGRVVALTRPGSPDRFLADIGRLFGVELHAGPVEPTAITVQGALF